VLEFVLVLVPVDQQVQSNTQFKSEKIKSGGAQ
jgi:hypothetical protein